MLTVFRSLTCFGLHREVGLPLQDGVDELGVVSKHGVVGIRGCHPGNRGPCGGGVRISSCDSSIWQGDYSKVISQQRGGEIYRIVPYFQARRPSQRVLALRVERVMIYYDRDITQPRQITYKLKW